MNAPPWRGISLRKYESTVCNIRKAENNAVVDKTPKIIFSPKLNETSAVRIESRIDAIRFFTIDKNARETDDYLLVVY